MTYAWQNDSKGTFPPLEWYWASPGVGVVGDVDEGCLEILHTMILQRSKRVVALHFHNRVMPYSRYEINHWTRKGPAFCRWYGQACLSDSWRLPGMLAGQRSNSEQRSWIPGKVEMEGFHISVTNPEFKALPRCFGAVWSWAGLCVTSLSPGSLICEMVEIAIPASYISSEDSARPCTPRLFWKL